jgi:hypothetical protein
LKQNKNKRVSYAEDKKEFTRYMRTYCEMTFGYRHPLSQQPPMWWGAQYDILTYKINKGVPKEKRKELCQLIPVYKIVKLGSQWHDTQEWTGEFHNQLAQVIMLAQKPS